MYKEKYLKYKKKYIMLIHNNLTKIEEEKKNNKKMKTLLIQYIFNILKKYDVCFIYGSIIFQDNNNILFNLLTYYILSTNECLPNIANTITKPKKHYTITHKEIFKNNNVLPDDCLKFNKINKLELELDDIDYLCDNNTPENFKQKKDKVTKRILLYYKFKYHNNTYLFFKLESYGMNHILHTVDYGKTLIGIEELTSYKTQDEYKKYREKYNNLKIKDFNFYNQFCQDNKLNFNKKLVEYYDFFIRTGNELFIPENIKNKLVSLFFNDIISFS